MLSQACFRRSPVGMKSGAFKAIAMAPRTPPLFPLLEEGAKTQGDVSFLLPISLVYPCRRRHTARSGTRKSSLIRVRAWVGAGPA